MIVKAEAFNSYFANISLNLADNIPMPPPLTFQSTQKVLLLPLISAPFNLTCVHFPSTSSHFPLQ